MLTTKKQSINTRLLFYAKLGDKLDAIGQQLVDILYNFQIFNEQAVTVEQIISQSQVFNSLQFIVTGRKQVVNKSIETNKNLNTNQQNSKLSNAYLNVYEKYLIDKRPLFEEFKTNLLYIIKQFVIIFSLLLVSTLVSAICLSPAFRNQVNLFLIYFVNSFNRLIGLDKYLNQRLSSKGYCNLPIVNGLQSAFLPPFNCDNCANLTEISKVTNLDYNQFEKSYLNRLIPVIVQDATTQWSALNEFTVDFLKKIYIETEGSLNYHDQNCQFFPYKTNYYNLADAFNNISTDHLDWYIGWSNCDSRIANKLRKYYQRPYFLPPDSLLTKTDWLFLGSPGYGAHLHIDNVGNPSWQAQIKGSKIWTIKPPFECLYKCSTLEVQVNPGEIIVLDTNRWYHKTLIVGDEISITIGSEFD